jgi:hypothetical protein
VGCLAKAVVYGAGKMLRRQAAKSNVQRGNQSRSRLRQARRKGGRGKDGRKDGRTRRTGTVKRERKREIEQGRKEGWKPVCKRNMRLASHCGLHILGGRKRGRTAGREGGVGWWGLVTAIWMWRSFLPLFLPRFLQNIHILSHLLSFSPLPPPFLDSFPSFLFGWGYFVGAKAMRSRLSFLSIRHSTQHQHCFSSSLILPYHSEFLLAQNDKK